MPFWRTLSRMSSNVASDFGSGLSSVGRGVGGSVFGLARAAVAQAPAAIAAYRGSPTAGFPIPPLGGGGLVPIGGQAGYTPVGIGGFAGNVLGGAAGTVLTDWVGGFGGSAPAASRTVAAAPVAQGSAAATIISNRKGKAYPRLPNDINSLVALRNAGLILRNADLIPAFRSPIKGYVAVRPWPEAPSAVIGMERGLAIRMGLFNPASKPLISIAQTSALRKANGAINALKRANKMAVKIANFNPGRRKAPAALPPPRKGR